MTCTSCVRTVEGVAVRGLRSIHVDLLRGRATLDFDGVVTTAESVCSSIESLGFDVTLINVEKASLMRSEFILEGMTCASCSKAVTNVVKTLDGVSEPITVTVLPRNKLELVHDPDLCSVERITEAIDAIGFGIVLVESKSIETLAHQVMYVRIERGLEQLKSAFSKQDGVISVTVVESAGNHSAISSDLENPLLSDGGVLKLEYEDSVIGLRTLIETVQVDTGHMELETPIRYATKRSESEGNGLSEIEKWKNSVLGSAVFALPVLLISMVFPHIPGMEGLEDIAFWGMTWTEVSAWILATPVQFISGGRFYREAWHSILNNALGMSLLIAIGTTAAYFYSVFAVVYNAVKDPDMRMMQNFESSALLITFVLFGKYLECFAKTRTSSAIAKLSQLSPSSASLVSSPYATEIKLIDHALIQRGDFLLVRSGEKVPTDGTVVRGSASVDESMLTGESVPALKIPDSKVIGGTMNVEGSLTMVVESIGENTTLAQIVKLVEDAQTSKAPIQAYADVISAKFVPFVLIASLTTLVMWVFLLNVHAFDTEDWPYKEDGLTDFTFSMLFSISVLVIACPCALGLATPTAIMVGTGVGARLGILIKGGEPLEAASNIDVVVFDKTGTLTMGAPVVGEVVLLSDKFKDDNAHTNVRRGVIANLLYYAACAENGSEHPLAKGILKAAAEYGIGNGSRKLVQPEKFENDAGLGIRCSVNGRTVHIGNRRCLEKNNLEIRQGTLEAMVSLENKGMTAITLSIDNTTEAVIGLIDQPKDDAAATVAILQQHMGIEVYMLTGDNSRTANIIAKELGISNVIADVIPSEKRSCVERLQMEGKRVAMIGDGVNDSPALAQAELGIAIGAGTDIAIEAAGMVLVNSKLVDVITAIDLSKVIMRRIHWNFLWAMGYNALGIPLAAGLLYPFTHHSIPPEFAAAAMTMSSVSVISSSLLLNRYSAPKMERKYGRTLRNGALGLERVTLNNSHIAVECRTQNENCDCIPNECLCPTCEEKIVLEKEWYPGCAREWGAPCACGENCKCDDCCKNSLESSY